MQVANIEGFEGYRVTSTGEVYAKNKDVFLKKQYTQTKYRSVNLYKEGKGVQKSIHRLVALAFIPNPENKPFINHIDGTRTNNNIENLEWCTNSENQIHAVETGLKPPTWLDKKGKDNPRSKKINQLTLEGELIGTFFGMQEAMRETGIDSATISRVLNKKTKKDKNGYTQVYKTAGGYNWEWAE